MTDGKSIRDVIWFHGAFTVVCLAVLFMPVPLKMGPRLFLLVIIYNTALPLTARFRGHGDWTAMWKVVFPISLLQILPDWFLSAVLGVLVFPADDGVFHIGTVSGYMAGLWAIPLFLIVFTGEMVRRKKTLGAGYIAAAITGLLIFGISEQFSPLLNSWYAKDVRMMGHIALYVLAPEVLLSMACFYVYVEFRSSPLSSVLIAAPAVAVFYTGALAISFLFFERAF